MGWPDAYLRAVFSAINEMEHSLRRLIAEGPDEEFRGIYLEGRLQATRRNVLVPGAIGVYTGGGTYNPAQVRRDDVGAANTATIDGLLADIGNRQFKELPVSELQRLVGFTVPDQSHSEHVWDPLAVAESLEQCADILGHDSGYVYVDRERDLRGNRRETQGVLSGGEGRPVPPDRLTLFMLRTTENDRQKSVWWPQVRFPSGRYALAFAV